MKIERTNDPNFDSICRLQVRRYRYVDINPCWTTNRGERTPGQDAYTFLIDMPPGCTWFYLRPEYHGNWSYQKLNGNADGSSAASSFDGWSIEAELEELPRETGGLYVRPTNTGKFSVFVNDIYTRCYEGPIGNLAPGLYKVRIEPLNPPSQARGWGFQPLTLNVAVKPNQMRVLEPTLALTEGLAEQGWPSAPVPVTWDYPFFRHRPARIGGALRTLPAPGLGGALGSTG